MPGHDAPLVARTQAHYEHFPFVQGGERRIRHWHRRLRPFLSDARLRGSVVLDLGCGSGEISRGLVERGAQLVAFDLTSAATRRTRALIPEALVCQANALHLPLRHGAVDHSVSIGVLHHTPDCLAGLREMARVTKHGGSIILLLYARGTPYHAAYAATAPLRRRVPVTALDLLPRWCWHAVRFVVAAQVGQWLGDKQLKALIADQFWTPQATFHSARTIASWAKDLNLVIHKRQPLLLHANLVELRHAGESQHEHHTS